MTTARELLHDADALLLDFDGPVAALMPPPANARAADLARGPLAGVAIPSPVAETTDHLAVLGYVRDEAAEFLDEVEEACTQAETEAARACRPSVHAIDLMDFAASNDIPVAVVSNNADRAVREFMTRRGWLHRVDAFACRTPTTVDWLKPKPNLLLLAADALRIDVGRAVFVGDAVSDVIAGKAAGIPVIGLAKNEQRRRQLEEAGATCVLDLGDRNDVLSALGAPPPQS